MRKIDVQCIRHTAKVGLSSIENLEWALRHAVLKDVVPLIHIHYKPQDQTATATLYIADVDEELADTLNIRQYNKEEDI